MDSVQEKVYLSLSSVNVYFTDHGCWNKIRCIVKLFVHFLVVIGVLFCGAFVFAIIEDSEVMMSESSLLPASERQNKSNLSNSDIQFWKNMQEKYNIQMNGDARKDLNQYFCDIYSKTENHHRPLEGCHDKDAIHTENQGKYFILMKWFYFVTTCTTTIGYGHLYPVTDQGKIFYMFFSIIGIALMMTLLKSCGSIITSFNLSIFYFFKRHCNQRVISDEVIALFCACLIFTIFMIPVVKHTSLLKGAVDQWSTVDCVYFWTVTFTTVGFGDVHFSLEAEVENAYVLLMYRILGLSFVAAILESVQLYMKYRKKVIKENIRKHSVNIRDRLITMRSEDNWRMYFNRERKRGIQIA